MSSNRLILIALVLILLTGLPACTRNYLGGTPTPPLPTDTPAPPTPTPLPAAARVNNESILLEEFQAEVERYQAAQVEQGTPVTSEQAAAVVMDDLIHQTLLAQGAREAGYVLDEQTFQARLEALASQAGGADKLAAWQTAHGYTSETFKSALWRSIEAAWMRDRIAASVPSTTEQVHVQQILLYNQDKALAVQAQLAAGKDFSELAAVYDPQTRGDLGWFPLDYIFDPQVEAAAFSLQPGQVSGIITSEVGFHILKVLERDPQRPLSPDARLEMQELALKNWLEEQRAKSTITLAP